MGALSRYHAEGADTAMGDARQQVRPREAGTPPSTQRARSRSRIGAEVAGPSDPSQALAIALATAAFRANPFEVLGGINPEQQF